MSRFIGPGKASRTGLGILLCLSALALFTLWGFSGEHAVTLAYLDDVARTLAPGAPPGTADGRPVHLTGEIEGLAPLVDPAFPDLAVEDALLIDRTVEMLQRQHTVDDMGFASTASQWSAAPVPFDPAAPGTTRGGHAAKPNPPFPFRSAILLNDGARLRGWHLAPQAATRMPGGSPCRTGGVEPPAGWRWIAPGIAYRGDPGRSDYGDMRAVLTCVPAGLVSLIGIARGESIIALAEPQPGLVLAVRGTAGAEAMIADARARIHGDHHRMHMLYLVALLLLAVCWAKTAGLSGRRAWAVPLLAAPGAHLLALGIAWLPHSARLATACLVTGAVLLAMAWAAVRLGRAGRGVPQDV